MSHESERPRVFRRIPIRDGGTDGGSESTDEFDNGDERQKRVPDIDLRLAQRLTGLETRAMSFVTFKHVAYGVLALSAALLVSILGWIVKFLLEYSFVLRSSP